MATWESRKVLVTGASGLVGSWLIKRLISEGAEVYALVLDHDPQSELLRSGDINKVSVINGNLSNFDDVRRAVAADKFDSIFHLGAQTIVGTALRDPLTTFTSNIQGTWNLLESVRVAGTGVKRILVASSDKAYGTKSKLPYGEEMSLEGDGPYDVSKSATDLIARSYGITYNLPVVIARCGNIYGGGDLNWSRIVPGTIRSLIKDEQPVIRSDGKFVRDYIYVEDAVDAYLYMAEYIDKKSIGGRAYNFSRNEPLTVLELYKMISQAVVGRYVEPLITNEARSEIHSQYLDSSRAREELGWNSNYELTKGLESTVTWYRKFFERS